MGMVWHGMLGVWVGVWYSMTWHGRGMVSHGMHGRGMVWHGRVMV